MPLVDRLAALSGLVGAKDEGVLGPPSFMISLSIPSANHRNVILSRRRRI